MKPSETAELLARITAFDRRTTGEMDIAAWHAAIGDLDLEDCIEAVVAYYRENREWLMPSDVRLRVKALRKERMGRLVRGAPDADPDDVTAYLAAQRAGRYRPYIEPEVERPVQLGRVFKQVEGKP